MKRGVNEKIEKGGNKKSSKEKIYLFLIITQFNLNVVCHQQKEKQISKGKQRKTKETEGKHRKTEKTKKKRKSRKE